ncbi:anthranilate phosphoribosyltransferase [Wallemia mellicola]|uniref:Anthranilate phosphoribosyltransferase n=1 Tax=Wallemia mellicola TaxID=1708541 RepID=A0A4V4N4E5_9BASI|nr:anthranilate phosphoribosyltransferase [Wallemia mellicola]TIC52503.1 anthranilate phosphoribosyltransferase [Wallemia mellicola]TIC68523.1 anthranilate phosphoribosyltransferase [Wallemia mellicola]
MDALTPDTFKPILKKLTTDADSFSEDDMRAAFEHIVRPDSHTAAQISAFLTALKLTQYDSKSAYIAAAATVMRSHSVQIDGLSSVSPTCDIVGTGGDGLDTFNVSTSAAVVAAGAGATVTKHGARSASSASGSADLLLSLGCSLSIEPSRLPSILSESKFAFLFASNYHPAMAHVAPLRREIGFPTIFNFLGPLMNPAKPARMVVGVAKRELATVFVDALNRLGVERAMVVRGKEGMDEISPEGETEIWELENGNVKEYTVSPASFGLRPHPLSAVKSGTPSNNANIFRAILSASTPSFDDIPKGVEIAALKDWILMNASALLVVSGQASNFGQGVVKARDSIESLKAKAALDAFKQAGQEVN